MKKFVKLLTITLSAAIFIQPSHAFAAESAKTVILGGQPFGVKFFNDGVMVIDLESFFSEGKYVCPAKEGGLEVNDVIRQVNETEVRTNEDLQRATHNCAGEPIRLTITRGEKELIKTIRPQKNMAGVYLSGAWVRDSCAGIGTVTYYDPESKCFAALGHGICDNDTQALMPLGSAEVVKANIGSVTKSSTGKAGSLNGYFSDTTLGDLTKNTDCGVFGTISDSVKLEGRQIELAENDEIRTGEAQVYTTVDGENADCYEVRITKLCDFDSSSNENFVIKITDDRLLSECGGIVQGMSGSPLVQDGKLVGAITHVFLNDPEEGYGVTVQNMVSNYQQ